MVEPDDPISDGLRAALLREAESQRSEPITRPASFTELSRALEGETGLRAWLSSRPTRLRITLMGLATVATAVAVVQFSARPDLADVGVRVTGAVLIYSCALIGALTVAMRPLHRPGWPIGAARLVLGAGLGGAIGLALLPLSTGLPLSSPGLPFAAGGMSCFLWGKCLSLPLLVLGWLMQRGGTDVTGRLLLTGGAAGLAGNLYLECHCPVQSPDHLLLGHVTIIFSMLLVGLLLSLIGKSSDGPGDEAGEKNPPAT